MMQYPLDGRLPSSSHGVCNLSLSARLQENEFFGSDQRKTALRL